MSSHSQYRHYGPGQAAKARHRRSSPSIGKIRDQLFNILDPLPGIVELEQRLLRLYLDGNKLGQAPPQVPQIVVIDVEVFPLDQRVIF